MTTLDDNPIKQALLKAIRKGNAQKLKDILKANPAVSANETLDSAENRLLHKAARYVYTFLHSLLIGDEVKNFHTLPPGLLIKCEGMKILYL